MSLAQGVAGFLGTIFSVWIVTKMFGFDDEKVKPGTSPFLVVAVLMAAIYVTIHLVLKYF